ncbi:MAG: carboxypeptidase regulatory-like domain-containing protein, partial [Acidobacteria bacterium]|nr:carboxypeptidase regulatory-like domain-containing protein [Acidobacteriota bacterium]
MSKRFAGASVAAMLVAAALVSLSATGRAASGAQAPEADISGVVTSANGPEEGVWVIAETTSLPTKFVKSVVTGDGGRYLIPDLPDATYDVWVRGYGLVDSDPVAAMPGDTVDVEATVAPTPADAAKVYPANYWYSLIQPPATGEFPGTGEDGNGIAATLQHQDQWVDIQKQGCMLCHQLGSRIIREI